MMPNGQMVTPLPATREGVRTGLSTAAIHKAGLTTDVFVALLKE